MAISARVLGLLAAIGLAALSSAATAESQWIDYPGGDGPGAGKKVVLISGDEEYRSEEVLPMLAKILATEHGFDCRVVFAINPETGYIDGNHQNNIPGLEALDDADLMVIFTRFRNLPDEQMAAIDRFLTAGKAVIGLRTATHAFQMPNDSPWARYKNDYSGKDLREWRGGFGRLVLGEKWISHHGQHKHESTRGVIAPDAKDHPIARGIASGDVWGATDVYGVRLPLPGDSQPILLGQVMQRDGDYDEDDLHYGMRPTDSTPVEGKKNDPLMPIAWTKSYQLPDGKEGKAFTSTIGASSDMTNEGVRRLVVNAAYWCVGLGDAIPEGGAKVGFVGPYNPTQFGFRSDDDWNARKLTVDTPEYQPAS